MTIPKPKPEKARKRKPTKTKGLRDSRSGDDSPDSAPKKRRGRPKLTTVNPEKMSSKQLATMLGVSTNSVGQWKRRGCPCNPDGTYNAHQVSEWRRLRDEEKARSEGGARELDRKRALEVQITELKLRRAQREVVEVKSVQGELERLCEQIKAHSLTMLDEMVSRLRIGHDGRKAMREARDAMLKRVGQAMDTVRGNVVSKEGTGGT